MERLARYGWALVACGVAKTVFFFFLVAVKPNTRDHVFIHSQNLSIVGKALCCPGRGLRKRRYAETWSWSRNCMVRLAYGESYTHISPTCIPNTSALYLIHFRRIIMVVLFSKYFGLWRNAPFTSYPKPSLHSRWLMQRSEPAVVLSLVSRWNQSLHRLSCPGP